MTHTFTNASGDGQYANPRNWSTGQVPRWGDEVQVHFSLLPIRVDNTVIEGINFYVTGMLHLQQPEGMSYE